jgi:hypothetical protein
MRSPIDEERKSSSGRIFKLARKSAVVVGVLAAVISMATAIHEFATQQKRANDEAEKTNRTMKATSLMAIIQVMDRDVDIKARAESFLKQYVNGKRVLAKAMSFQTVSEAYHSRDFADLSAVGHHYEILGALAKKDYIDMDLIFTIIDFPDMFWERTKEFRDLVRMENLRRPGASIVDFWENFEWLHGEYEKRRGHLRGPRKTPTEPEGRPAG